MYLYLYFLSLYETTFCGFKLSEDFVARFKDLNHLELFIFITYFSTVIPLNSCFLSCRPFAVNSTFSPGLVGMVASSPGVASPGVPGFHESIFG